MYGTGIAIDSSDNLYQMSNFAGLNCWVRRSTNGGASWNDVLVNPFGGFCNAGQLAVDTTNRVYAFVSYRFNTPIDPYRGYVYSSSDAGLTWTLIDDPSDFSPMGWDRTGSVFRDPNGGIFMTGSAPDAQGVQRFLIKRIDL